MTEPVLGDCSRCTLNHKAILLRRTYKAMPDHLAKIGDQRAEIDALRANNSELRRVLVSRMAALAVGAFFCAMGGER